MYAVIEVGAKQYVVRKGDVIKVEKIEAKDGAEVALKEVLLVAKDSTVEIGQPHVKGAKVLASVVKQTKGEKTVAFKYRRRKSSDTKTGHRQKLTELKISGIELGA